MAVRTWSLVTTQGTAMPEATLCETHVTVATERNKAIMNARQAGDWNGIAGHNIETTDNNEVACIICGRGGDPRFLPDVADDDGKGMTV